jgi:hypothetical protein
LVRPEDELDRSRRNKKMNGISRGIVFLSLTALLLASLVGTSLSMPEQPGDRMVSKEAGNGSIVIEKTMTTPESHSVIPDDSWINYISHNWRGFAIKDDEAHVVRMSIESVRFLDPSCMRRLLDSTASIEEIRTEMKKVRGDVIHKGFLSLGKQTGEASSESEDITILGKEDRYRLIDIKMTPSGDYTVIDAGVVELKRDSAQTDNIVGHLTLNASDYEIGTWAELSEGQLTINNGSYPGKYRLLLETRHSYHEMSNTAGEGICSIEMEIEGEYAPGNHSSSEGA